MAITTEHFTEPENIPGLAVDERWDSIDQYRGFYVISSVVSVTNNNDLESELRSHQEFDGAKQEWGLNAIEADYVTWLGLHAVSLSELSGENPERILRGILETERMAREDNLQTLTKELDVYIGRNPVMYPEHKPFEPGIPPEAQVLTRAKLLRFELFRERTALADRLRDAQ